jgi:four helix bundle protein
MEVVSYRDLIVWQKSMALVVAVYELVKELPAEERYGLVSQMQRAAVSIPSNIAEGKMRGTRKDYVHFLRIAHGSGAELETQLERSQRLYRISDDMFLRASTVVDEIMRMLNVMIRKLSN